MKKSILSLATAALLSGLVAHAQTTMPVFMSPPPDINYGAALRELFDHPDEWTETRSLIGGILYADHGFNEFSDADLGKWLGMMNQWHLKLQLEVGGVKEWGVTGAGTLKGEQADWDRITRLGGHIDSIAMDEPLCCSRFIMHKSDAYVAKETAKFIALVRKAYPDLLIGEIEPYPSIPIEDHVRWIKSLQKELAALHVRSFDFYRVDTDWNSFAMGRGNWKGVVQIQHYCNSQKIPFSLCIWSSDTPYIDAKFHIADDSSWYVGIQHMGYSYLAAGGHPDQYVIESWIPWPSHSVPETGDWTFTRSVRDFVKKFVPPAQQK